MYALLHFRIFGSFLGLLRWKRRSSSPEWTIQRRLFERSNAAQSWWSDLLATDTPTTHTSHATVLPIYGQYLWPFVRSSFLGFQNPVPSALEKCVQQPPSQPHVWRHGEIIPPRIDVSLLELLARNSPRFDSRPHSGLPHAP